MRKYLQVCVIAASLGFALDANGQDIHFSQFYENAILRNPALTGIFSGDYKAGVNYREQWATISPFSTALISAESRVLINKEVGDYLSFGLTGTYDKAGTINFTSMQIFPAVNYNKSLEDKHNTYLSLGFMAGYIQRSVDMSQAIFTSQFINGEYNASNPTNERVTFTNMHDYDLGAGISLNSSLGPDNKINYYIGAAAYHITQPNQSFAGDAQFIRLSTKWSGNLGVKYIINNQCAITMHMNYTRQAPYQETIGGGLVSWKAISPDVKYNFVLYAGLFYRLGDAMIPTVKLDYMNYSLTMSYDINNSGLKPATNGAGGYEISLYIRGKFPKAQRASDAVRCPGFEDLNTRFGE